MSQFGTRLRAVLEKYTTTEPLAVFLCHCIDAFEIMEAQSLKRWGAFAEFPQPDTPEWYNMMNTMGGGEILSLNAVEVARDEQRQREINKAMDVLRAEFPQGLPISGAGQIIVQAANEDIQPIEAFGNVTMDGTQVDAPAVPGLSPPPYPEVQTPGHQGHLLKKSRGPRTEAEIDDFIRRHPNYDKVACPKCVGQGVVLHGQTRKPVCCIFCGGAKFVLRRKGS